ncbi:MAG TPA: hypothetical protein VK281_16695 [Xanthobacteraceae bacterium]|nr:hypothetical protein [Xanthobacteraceae bacterium]
MASEHIRCRRATNMPCARRDARLLLLLALVATNTAGAPWAGDAAAEGVTRRVRFAPGSQTATISGGLVRGDRDAYLLRANAGQWMRVSISSGEHNAVFQIAGPDGRELAGAGAADDAERWSGALARSGEYRISIGGTRGNATYTLTVGIDRK